MMVYLKNTTTGEWRKHEGTLAELQPLFAERKITLGDECALGIWCTLGDGCRLGVGCTLGDECALGNWKYNITPLQIQGTRHLLNVASPTDIKIGCFVLPTTTWIKEFCKIGKANGYTAKEIAEYHGYILLAQKWMKTNCPGSRGKPKSRSNK